MPPDDRRSRRDLKIAIEPPPELIDADATLRDGLVSISAARGLRVGGEALGGALGRDELLLGARLGAGTSSVVYLATRAEAAAAPALGGDGAAAHGGGFGFGAERVAVKLFNVLDEAKRAQLLNEVRALFALSRGADGRAAEAAELLVGLRGAYRERGSGRVGVVLE